MRKTLAASLLFSLFLVLVGLTFFLSNRPAGRDVPLGPSAAVSVPRFEKEGPGEIHKIPLNPPFPKGDPLCRPVAAALAAVIVDDFGYNLDVARALCALGRPVTAAILPYAPQTRETALLAAGCGVEIMLHLPLEALVPKENSAGRIGSGMTADEVRARVAACLDQVPGSRGVNNHEGSKATVDAVLMTEILNVLNERNLYFVDSLTTNDTIAFDTARGLGVPAAVRRVFLDGVPRTGRSEKADGAVPRGAEIRPGRRHRPRPKGDARGPGPVPRPGRGLRRHDRLRLPDRRVGASCLSARPSGPVFDRKDERVFRDIGDVLGLQPARDDPADRPPAPEIPQRVLDDLAHGETARG